MSPQVHHAAVCRSCLSRRVLYAAYLQYFTMAGTDRVISQRASLVSSAGYDVIVSVMKYCVECRAVEVALVTTAWQGRRVPRPRASGASRRRGQATSSAPAPTPHRTASPPRHVLSSASTTALPCQTDCDNHDNDIIAACAVPAPRRRHGLHQADHHPGLQEASDTADYQACWNTLT